MENLKGDRGQRAQLESELSVLLFLVVVTLSLGAIVDPDLPGHVAYGLDHLRSGQLQRTDPYSYSALGDAWVNHEWVFELTSAWVFMRLGGGGLVALQAFAWSATGALVLWRLRKGSRDLVPGAILYLLFAALAFAAITIRPQLFTYLLFAVLLVCLEEARGGRLWTLAAAGSLFALWVNLHGGFLAGLGVIGLYTLGLLLDAALKRGAPGDQEAPPARPWLLFGLAAAACFAGAALTLANPYGMGLHAFLVESLGRPRPMIGEWRGVAFDAQGVLFLLAIVGVFVAVWRRRSQTPAAHLAVLAVTAALGVRHARHVPFFAIAACMFASGAVAALYRRYVPPPEADLDPRAIQRLRALYVVVLVPALALSLAWPQRDTLSLRLRPVGNSTFPTGALVYMDQVNLEGNVLCDFDWAQLVIWRHHPRVHVFYDGRFRTVYSAAIEEAYFDFVAPLPTPAWRRALDDWKTEWVLIPAGSPAAARMHEQPDWRVAYQDRQAVLFTKRITGEVAPEPVLGEPLPELPFEPR